MKPDLLPVTSDPGDARSRLRAPSIVAPASVVARDGSLRRAQLQIDRKRQAKKAAEAARPAVHEPDGALLAAARQALARRRLGEARALVYGQRSVLVDEAAAEGDGAMDKVAGERPAAELVDEEEIGGNTIRRGAKGTSIPRLPALSRVAATDPTTVAGSPRGVVPDDLDAPEVPGALLTPRAMEALASPRGPPTVPALARLRLDSDMIDSSAGPSAPGTPRSRAPYSPRVSAGGQTPRRKGSSPSTSELSFYRGADEVDDLDSLLGSEEVDANADRYDEALARGVEYADDADAVEFLEEEELSLPAWKRRVLVRERMAAARARADRAAKEARVRQLVAAKRVGDHRGAEMTFASTADAASNIVEQRTLRRGGHTRAQLSGAPALVHGERKVTSASRKVLRQMATDLLDEMDAESLAHLAKELVPAARSRLVNVVVDDSADAWLLTVSKYVVMVLNDRAAAGRLRSHWFTTIDHLGVVGTVKSVLNQALTSGITAATLVDGVRRTVQVMLLELQDVVPACKETGVPIELYEEVVFVIGLAIMTDVVENALQEP
jgi:hypothetical protein